MLTALFLSMRSQLNEAVSIGILYALVQFHDGRELLKPVSG